MSVEILILVDNVAGSDQVKAAHGFAAVVSGPGRKVLFDAGPAEELLLANAGALGVDLASLDAAVVSHGHHDHTGGLVGVVRRRPGLEVFAHAGAFHRRWSERAGRPLTDVSCPHSLERLRQAGAAFHSVAQPEVLADWLVVSGPIGGPKHGREIFVVRRDGEMVVDGFEDEMCLLARGQGGWAVVTGCCHRGLRNTLRTARFLARGEPLAALVGGLHLRSAGPAELDEALDLIRQHNVRDIYPCHCTGAPAVALFRERLPGHVHPVAVGSRVIF